MFPLKMGPRRAPKIAQNGTQNEPKMSQLLGPKRAKKGDRKGVKSGLKSIAIVVLRERPKGGVRKSLENNLEGFVVARAQNGPRRFSKGFSSPGAGRAR